MNFKGVLDIDINLNGIPVTEIAPLYDKPTSAVIYYNGFAESVKTSLFRGKIMASLGYLVLLVEQKGHGTRSNEIALDYKKPDSKMWDVVIASITESPNLISYLVEKKGIKSNKIIFAGHSMGAFVAAGAFTKSPLGKLVMFNGSLDLMGIAEHLNRNYVKDPDDLKETRKHIQYYDPASQLSKLENRPIILVDGPRDLVVPPKFNSEVVGMLYPFYKNKNLLKHIIVDQAAHPMTAKGLEYAFAALEEEGIVNYGD